MQQVAYMKRTQLRIDNVTRLLAALTDPIRLRLVRLLLREELCVCELVDALGMPQYKVSRHLGTLRRAQLVTVRRRGRWMHYRLGESTGEAGFARRLIEFLDRELLELADVKRDDRRLAERLRLRRSGECVVGITRSCR